MDDAAASRLAREVRSGDGIRWCQPEHARNHHRVQDNRTQRGDEEMSAGIGHPDEHRRQAHQQHVGEHQT